MQGFAVFEGYHAYVKISLTLTLSISSTGCYSAPLREVISRFGQREWEGSRGGAEDRFTHESAETLSITAN